MDFDFFDISKGPTKIFLIVVVRKKIFNYLNRFIL